MKTRFGIETSEDCEFLSEWSFYEMKVPRHLNGPMTGEVWKKKTGNLNTYRNPTETQLM